MRHGGAPWLVRRTIGLLTAMDARAWRGLAVSFVLFGGVGVVFLVGARMMGVTGPDSVRAWFTATPGPLALPAVMGAFALLAFLGVPQFILIAAAVVAFGPIPGFCYSWAGTLVSAMVGFWLGRAFGARLLAGLGGPGLARFMALVGAHGFVASLVVRLAPFAPFVVVNMAAGVTPMRQRDFAAGTAIGILPKIALTAFAGSQVVRALHGGGRGDPVGPGGWIGLALAGAAWLALGLMARRWLRRREAETP